MRPYHQGESLSMYLNELYFVIVIKLIKVFAYNDDS